MQTRQAVNVVHRTRQVKVMRAWRQRAGGKFAVWKVGVGPETGTGERVGRGVMQWW